MSSNSKTEDTILLENKPYLTKQEISVLLQKTGRNLDKKVSQLLKKGYLLTLKNGLYTTEAYIKSQSAQSREFLATALYYPSYLSLEYVLQKEGLIPEAVYAYTSITLKPTKVFTNTLGTFIYRTIKESLFTGYQFVRYNESYQTKIASGAKALFDLLYLKPLPRTVSGKRQVIADLRINWATISKDDMAEFATYVKLSQSQKMTQVVNIIAKEPA
ncbi:MAG: hypothetical protein A2632_01855 [Candidatus Pacebacteria bacterium RIFCSPHIGHO2_01_FULL_46_16]|nr:MAG: hypothetical protein A2632_01855 [Candidatus Pacebacteria bacterium RIFCSPHIGHO2_01_FULL_46_16]OGJ21994.1 MAG: hypothetical protein A3J60_02795 [Candidatus Pacebacteria bacterium RIFCSPHIGHO2_02_FULL_46_9]OGJ37974.1 MAG: hypothetical protein A3A82_00725 [Candidatus Pacebacteria bacterium RIFCSPLOWO2_01_FULL_47_12]